MQTKLSDFITVDFIVVPSGIVNGEW